MSTVILNFCCLIVLDVYGFVHNLIPSYKYYRDGIITTGAADDSISLFVESEDGQVTFNACFIGQPIKS